MKGLYREKDYMKHNEEELRSLKRDLHYVSYQVLEYLEGFHLAATDCELSDIVHNHARNSFEVIERVFKELDLKSLGYDVRHCYDKLWFNSKEVYRISDEVRPTIENYRYQFRLKDHRPEPDRLDPLFDELFTYINVDESAKSRFKASLSTIMTQCIRDILKIDSDRARFALVLYGCQGCGKTTFNSTLCKVMIGKDVHIQKNNLYTNFDSQEILNPVFRVEDLNYKFRDVIDVMKTYITNVAETTINVKYQPEQRVVIRTTPLLDTNNDFINIIKTDGEQRRFCIFELIPSEKRVKDFEVRLQNCLTKIFRCHTTEYYYNLNELMEENLRLTDRSEEFLSRLEFEFKLTESPYTLGETTDWSGKYTERELKKKLMSTLTAFDDNDDYLTDGLLLRVERKYFYKEYDTHRKTNVFTLKTIAVKAVKAGKIKNPFKDDTPKSFSKTPLKPLLPQPLTEFSKEVEFEEFLSLKRDAYISNSIIAPHRFLFYDDEVEEAVEVEEVKLPTLEPVDVHKLYSSDTVQNHFNTKFSCMVPLRNLEDFKETVGYDNTGCEFTDDTAKNENFQSTNVLLIDVDSHDGEDLSNINDVDKLGVKYFRVHSKSGRGYHFYFPLSHEIKDTTTFGVVMNSLMDSLRKVGVEPDKACKNPSRKFFGTKYRETAIYHEGVEFNVIEAVKGLNRSKVDDKRAKKQLSSPYKIIVNVGSPESDNQALTDQYFLGNVNAGHVVEDLPHIINYLLTLKDNKKSFYSSTTNKSYKIDVVIDEIKEAVKYDPTHIKFIETIVENHGGK
jgi:hypothetical protein